MTRERTFDFRKHLHPQRAPVGEDGPAKKTADLGAWLNRGQPDPQPSPTIFTDVKELWADIAASPTSHAVVGFAGVLLGLAVTLGPALVWSWWL